MIEDAALFLLRAVLGTFYVLARFRFFYDPSRSRWLCPDRRRSLVNKVQICGWLSTAPRLWACVVAVVEVLGGAALIVGFLTQYAALSLLGVTLVATYYTARDKVTAQKPVDKLDCVSCYLWRVEGVYIAIALAILALGPGRWSIDYLWS